MASTRAQRGSHFVFLLGVCLVLSKGGVGLELLPSTSRVVLNSNTNFSAVCRGWGQVRWRLPQDSPESGVLVKNNDASSVLQLINATWRYSGRYTCEEASSHQTRDLDIFIPGGDPEEWFVNLGTGVVMKEAEEGTIPCAVSDPQLNVSLFLRPGRTQVIGVTYEPSHGFTGPLNDTSYVCIATRDNQQTLSQVFYVFTILLPQVLHVDLSVSSVLLKQGEVLTVNCSVTDTDMVFFNWDFPRRQKVEPLTEFLSNQIRSFINISSATMEDSGVYMCDVQETRQGRRVTKNVTVTVLERGYVHAWSHDTNVSSLHHHTVDLSVEVDAYPSPTIVWTTGDNQTIATETSFVATTHLTGSRYTSKLTLVRVQMDQTGNYTATVSNDDDVAKVVLSMEVKAPPRITSLSEISSRSMLCVSEGAPAPSVTWYTCHSSHRCSWRNQSATSENITEVKKLGIIQVSSELSLHSLTSVTSVRCEVKNVAGHRVRDLQVASTSLLSQLPVMSSILALVIVAIILLIILIVLWRKKPHYEFRWKVIESVSHDGQQYTYVDPEDLPYNSTWEIPRDSIELGQVLGSGAFGCVVEANVSSLTSPDSTTKVAVKMVKQKNKSVQSLTSELKILAYLGPHLNVVNLLGACTSPTGPIYLITEFCRHRDLQNYLQGNKHTFLQSDTPNKSDSDGGYMDMNKEGHANYVAMKTLLNYADIKPIVYETPYRSSGQQEASSFRLNDSAVLSPNDLLSFSYQISQAMDFLSSRNCVHRDLAARNVLVCEGNLVKVCDFGLGRDMTKDQNYVARGNNFLPLKWMAPESVFQSVYSSQSDVWSYGILLWEIFSLGASPYPDLPMTQEFYTALKRRYRMTCPDHAPQNIFKLMTGCWEEEPQSRPSFSIVVLTVGNMLTDEQQKRYTQLTESFLKAENPAVFRSQAAQTLRTPTSQEKAHLVEKEPEEAGISHDNDIISIDDVSQKTSDGAALDAASCSDPPLSSAWPGAISPAGQHEPEEEEESNL